MNPAEFNHDFKIGQRLYHDLHYVKSKGYNVLGVFLQGSQNYELDYEGSDIDTKVILIPSFKDIVLNKKPVSTTLILPSNEHIDIKDIRLYMECFKKQNINFLEILFTKYFLIYDTTYDELFRIPMQNNAELIAHYNNYKAVNSIYGMALEKQKALCHPYPSKAEQIKKYGYDNKQLHHILRCEDFLKRYISGELYKDCLIPKNKKELIDIKSKYIYTLEGAKIIADECITRMANMKEKYMKENDLNINKDVEEIMNYVLYNVLSKSLAEEIKGDNIK